MAEIIEKQVKSGRISKPQRRRLLDLMKEHRHVGKGQFFSKDSKKEHNAVWEAVAKELNAMGGSFKNSNQWKKSWIDWKSSIKQQYGRHRAFENRTGNLPSSEGPKPMNFMDKEVLDFFSKDVVDGDGYTPEGGFEAIAPVACEVDVICLDDSHLEVLEEWVPANDLSFPAKRREPSSQSCLEEVKKICGENQAQIVEALKRVIDLIEIQNGTLAQMLHCLQNNN